MTLRRTALPLLLLVLSVLVFVPFGLGQTEAATLSGLITDPQSKVVPDVAVEVTNVDTNATVHQTTNGAGLYVVVGLKPGRYRVSVTKEGFRRIDLTDLVLNVQDVLSRNFQLQLGPVMASITVVAEASNVNTTDASVSTVVDQTYVRNMPLNGRSLQDLIELAPGVFTQTPQASQLGIGGLGISGEFSVNGQRTESNYYTVDGVSANLGATSGMLMVSGGGLTGSFAASTALGTTQALVSVDDLQEFRVQTSTYSAEYGRNPGGQFAFDTKSGTNQWHGTAYDYLRNNFFDANDWFNDYLGVKEPALRQNDFGGTFGGPLEFPRLYNGKDRTFFFVSYEGLRLVQPQAASINFVPDATLRANAPTPLNQTLNAWPLPSPNGIDDTANGFAQFIGSWSNPSSLNSTSVRFDQVVNNKLRLFFRFSDTGSRAAARGTYLESSTPTNDQISGYTFRTYTAGASSLFSSRLSNEFRLNYSSNESTNNVVIDGFGGSTPVDLVHLSGLGPASEPFITLLIGPYFTALTQEKSSGAQRQWNFVDTLSLSLGRHQVKLGVDYRRLAPFAIQPTPTASYIYFSPSSVQSNSADFIFAQALAPAYPLYKNFSAFVQDGWRVSQRLTLSLGLRWEVNPPPSVTQGLKPYTFLGSSPDNWALAPQGTPLWQTTWYNFAPRVGAAYLLHDAPGKGTVLRGGGGVFFDTGQQLGSQGFQGPGFFSDAFASGPFPGGVVIPSIVNPPSLADVGIAYGFAPHLQLPYTLQWNGSIEQGLGQSQALTISYVGSHASRLLQFNEFQPANNPSGAAFFFTQNGLTSDYNSLQVQFRRRLSRELTALGSYTWSHCIDYGSSNFLFQYQRSNCDFDVRHNLSAALSYDFPNVRHSPLMNAVLHHWGLDDRFTARTAFPVTLVGTDLLQPNGQFFHAGLDLVPGQPVYLYGRACASVLQQLQDLAPGQGCPGGRAINPNAFAQVPIDPNTGNATRLGTAPRNFARGFGAWQMNMAVRRDFPIRERLKIQFRAEAFNIFNHPNFGTINPVFGQPTFGQATGTLANSLGILSPIYQQGGPRSMQFALKLAF